MVSSPLLCDGKRGKYQKKIPGGGAFSLIILEKGTKIFMIQK